MDGIGWVPSDATPIQLSSNVDASARRARAKMGKYGWRRDITLNCLANFGNDSGLLLLSSAGFEMGAPIVQIGPVGNDMGKTGPKKGTKVREGYYAAAHGNGVYLNQREFQVVDLAVSSYAPSKDFKDDLQDAIDALKPVNPNVKKEVSLGDDYAKKF